VSLALILTISLVGGGCCCCICVLICIFRKCLCYRSKNYDTAATTNDVNDQNLTRLNTLAYVKSASQVDYFVVETPDGPVMVKGLGT
jgi:hypothetical protein